MDTENLAEFQAHIMKHMESILAILKSDPPSPEDQEALIKLYPLTSYFFGVLIQTLAIDKQDILSAGIFRSLGTKLIDCLLYEQSVRGRDNI